MRRMRAMGVCVVSVLALSLVVAATASAALPELGRCAKVAVAKTGTYKASNCIAVVPGKKGEFEFTAGAGAKSKYTAVGGPTKLETTKGLKIECTASSLSGEYTGAKTDSTTAKLTGCSNPALGLKCQNPGPTAKEGEIETPAAIESELGFIKAGEKPLVGLDLKAKAPATTIVAFECGKFPSGPVHGTIEGSVIAPITPINTMKSEFKLIYNETLGVQTPEKFEGGAKDTLVTKLFVGAEEKVEATALKVKFVIKNEELLEIKAK